MGWKPLEAHDTGRSSSGASSIEQGAVDMHMHAAARRPHGYQPTVCILYRT